MLRIIVVDRSAEDRSMLLDRLQQLLDANRANLDILPRIDLRPLAQQELKFHQPSDICVIGSQILAQDFRDVGEIRRLLPETALIAALSAERASFPNIEQLARLGIDDTLLPDTSPSEFLRKVVLLSRRARRGKCGKLILIDSGKGGLGVTSIAAGLADVLVTKEKKVVLIDLDFSTQDLSRFLQCRPFINENLQLLLDQQRPITQEYVDQCLVTAWEHGQGLLTCMSPVEENVELHSSSSNYSRTFLSVLEILDHRADCIIVDLGNARGTILETLYRVADKVLFVINNDPATLYASTDRLAQLRGLLSAESEIVLISNSPTTRGLRQNTLIEEFSRTLGINEASWSQTCLPYCASGQRWPGSGGTLYSLSRSTLRRAFEGVLTRLGFVGTEKPLESQAIRLLQKIKATLPVIEFKDRTKLVAPALERLLKEAPKKLPESPLLLDTSAIRSSSPDREDANITALISPAVVS